MERLLISKEGLRYDIIYNLINYIGKLLNDAYASDKAYDVSDAMWVPSINDILAEDWDYIH